MDTNTEKKDDKNGTDGPTEAQLQLQQAEQKEREECWASLQAVLDKYGYQYNPAVHISANKGLGFVIDIVKKPKQ